VNGAFDGGTSTAFTVLKQQKLHPTEHHNDGRRLESSSSIGRSTIAAQAKAGVQQWETIAEYGIGSHEITKSWRDTSISTKRVFLKVAGEVEVSGKRLWSTRTPSDVQCWDEGGWIVRDQIACGRSWSHLDSWNQRT
jgi:hypothetical protein